MKSQSIPRKEWLLLALLAPVLGLLLGGIYAYPAMRLTKEREPWLTLLLGAGLGVTIFGIGWTSHAPLPHLLGVWFVSLVLLLVVRAVFGLRGNLEHYGMVHVATLLLVVLTAALQAVAAPKQAARVGAGADPGTTQRAGVSALPRTMEATASAILLRTEA